MELPPRPASLRRLQEIKESKEYEFWAWGTHSILDMDRVMPADADAEAEHGAVRVLSAAEVRDLLGSERPTAHDSEAMDPGDDLGLDGFCSCGRCTVLYRDGHPHELAFWGISGD